MQLENVYVVDTTTGEGQLEGVYLVGQEEAPPGGLSIPVAIHDYRMRRAS